MKLRIMSAIVLAMCFAFSVQADTSKLKYATDIPASVTTPDSVETRLGILRFFDGMPDDKIWNLGDFELVE